MATTTAVAEPVIRQLLCVTLLLTSGISAIPLGSTEEDLDVVTELHNQTVPAWIQDSFSPDEATVDIPATDRDRGNACNNEGLPLCDLTSHDIYPDYPYMFEVLGQGLVDRIVPVFKVAQFHGACVIDPFLGVDIDQQTTTPISVEIEIHCHSPNTRVAFRPSVNLSDTTAFTKLTTVNCSMYWNDLSLFGQHSHFLEWESSGWWDEFIEGLPEHFYDCIHSLGINTDDVKEIHPSISGLQTLVSLSMHCDENPQTPSPVFTRYRWPNLAEAVFNG